MPQADVVIMGGGLAGLVAGNRALELGLRAIILERGATTDYLCDSRVATGAIHLASTSPKADPETIVAKIVEKTAGFANEELARALAERAADAIDWLEAHGGEFIQSPTPRYWLAPTRGRQQGLSWEGWGPDLTLKRLTERFMSHGGQFALATEGRELVFDQGVCTGIRATTNSRDEVFEAKSVFLADGGFQANTELIRRFITPAAEKIVKRNTETAIGTGVLMAEQAGAALVGMQYFYGHLLSRDALENSALWPYPTMDLLSSASIVVDSSGRRIADEGLGGIYLANQIARRPDPADCWLILDDALWNSNLAIRTADPGNPDSPNPDLKGLGGTLIEAPTIAEVAAATGLPGTALAETVASFNAAVRSGDLSNLQPPRRQAPAAAQALEKPPFYAIPLCVGLTFTMGGPAVDGNCRVLRPDGSPIEGLFVIGSAIGGLEGGEHVGYWGGLSQALITGLRAAEYVADLAQAP